MRRAAGCAAAGLALTLVGCGQGRELTTNAVPPATAAASATPVAAATPAAGALTPDQVCASKADPRQTVEKAIGAQTGKSAREWHNARNAKYGNPGAPINQAAAIGDNDPVTLCVFRGAVNTPHPPGVPDADTAIYVIRQDGHPIMLSAGPHNEMAKAGLTPQETQQLK